MKIIKFDLPINGTKVRNLEELRDNFTTEILELHDSGVLLKWLKSRDLMDEAEKLAAIADAQDEVDKLVVLCEVFGVDAGRAVIEAALSKGDDSKGAALHADSEELKYKEKFERLSALMDELKSKKLYINDIFYHRFVKNKLEIETDGKVLCVTFDEKVYRVRTRDFGLSYGGRIDDMHFKFIRSLGEVIEVGDVIGYILDGENPAYVNYYAGEIISPLRGILIEIAEFHKGTKSYFKDDPVCYIRVDHDAAPSLKIFDGYDD